MYISIINKSHPEIKYCIIDSTIELNNPVLPNNCTIAFQEKYKTDLKILSESELKEIFKDNRLLFEIVFFNSSFKLSEYDVKKYVKVVLDKKFNQIFSLNSNLKFNSFIKNIENFIFRTDMYTKNEIDIIISGLNEKIIKIQNDINGIKFDEDMKLKNELNIIIEEAKKEIKIIKEKLGS